MLDTRVLNQLLLEAFSGTTTWLEASTRYDLNEFIETFHRTRELMIKTVADLTDEQAAFQIAGNSTWSISEMVTHLIYTQGFYYNHLLDMSTSQLPHLVEAAKGFGEGARLNVPSAVLQANLRQATALINDAIEKTRQAYDPEKITVNEAFGRCTYRTWMLLMLGHEVDHVRQGIVMRRAARAAMPGSKGATSTVVEPVKTAVPPESAPRKPKAPRSRAKKKIS